VLLHANLAERVFTYAVNCCELSLPALRSSNSKSDEHSNRLCRHARTRTHRRARAHTHTEFMWHSQCRCMLRYTLSLYQHTLTVRYTHEVQLLRLLNWVLYCYNSYNCKATSSTPILILSLLPRLAFPRCLFRVVWSKPTNFWMPPCVPYVPPIPSLLNCLL
jgi:hypothetical protein